MPEAAAAKAGKVEEDHEFYDLCWGCFFILTLSALILEIVALLWLRADQITLFWYLVLHFCLVGALVFCLYQVLHRRIDSRFYCLLVIAAAFLGPFGAAGSLISAFFCRLWSKDPEQSENRLDYLYPDQDAENWSKSYERIKTKIKCENEDNLVTSYYDVIKSSTPSQKQAAVASIARNFEPGFAPILQQALNDSENAVRVQAASAMTKIETSFLEKTVKLSRELENDPDDAEAYLRLARHFHEIVVSGILDDLSERAACEGALSNYRSYLRFEPESIGAKVAIGELLMKSSRTVEAEIWLKDCLEVEKDRKFPILSSYLESLYLGGKFKEVRRTVAQYYSLLSKQAEESALAKNILALWHVESEV